MVKDTSLCCAGPSSIETQEDSILSKYLHLHIMLLILCLIEINRLLTS